MQVAARTLHNFKYCQDSIDPTVFASHLLLNIAGTDPKKRPSFHLGMRLNCGENHAPILAISFSRQLMGFFGENGQRIQQYNFNTLIGHFESDPTMAYYEMPRHYETSDTPPVEFRFAP